MLTLKEVYNIEKEDTTYILQNKSNLQHISSALKRYHIIAAINSFFEENNISQTKYNCYICGLLDAFSIQNYQDRMFDYDIHSIGYAMLSDNLPFLKNVYANLTYHTFYLEDDTRKEIPLSMDEMVEDGEPAIFVHTVQQFLKGNNELIERNLQIMEEKYLPHHSQNPEVMCYDVAFFKALYNKNKEDCEKILKEMVTPKIHKMRNVDSLLNKYISMPVFGYAKLAWICSVEVDVKSKLIPKELLPVQPLEKYDIPYEFLKGIDNDNK